jgi:hypothetical protein
MVCHALVQHWYAAGTFYNAAVASCHHLNQSAAVYRGHPTHSGRRPFPTPLQVLLHDKRKHLTILAKQMAQYCMEQVKQQMRSTEITRGHPTSVYVACIIHRMHPLCLSHCCKVLQSPMSRVSTRQARCPAITNCLSCSSHAIPNKSRRLQPVHGRR